MVSAVEAKFAIRCDVTKVTKRLPDLVKKPIAVKLGLEGFRRKPSLRESIAPTRPMDATPFGLANPRLSLE